MLVSLPISLTHFTHLIIVIFPSSLKYLITDFFHIYLGLFNDNESYC